MVQQMYLEDSTMRDCFVESQVGLSDKHSLSPRDPTEHAGVGCLRSKATVRQGGERRRTVGESSFWDTSYPDAQVEANQAANDLIYD